jgi:SHS2 domain-containing protein
LGFELFSHPADIGVRAWGDSLEEALEEAALGLVAVQTDLDLIEPREERRLEVVSPDEEFLLFDFLNEVVFFMAREKMLFGQVKVFLEQKENQFFLEAKMKGEKIKPEKHKPAVEIKGVSWHELKVKRKGKGYWVQCVLDV